jgi:hypothetical protein
MIVNSCALIWGNMSCKKIFHESERTEKKSIRLHGIYVTESVKSELDKLIDVQGYKNQQQLSYCLLLEYLEKNKELIREKKRSKSAVKEDDMLKYTQDLLKTMQQMHDKLKIMQEHYPTSVIYPIQLQQNVANHIQNLVNSIQRLQQMGTEQAEYFNNATHNMLNPPDDKSTQLPNQSQPPPQQQYQQPQQNQQQQRNQGQQQQGQPLGKIG